MTDARKRIAELEEALRPFAPTPEVLQAIQYIHDSGELYLSENGWQIGPITAGDLRRAASLLSAAPPANKPEHKCYDGYTLRQRDNDIGILIAIVESLSEASGESLDTEDNALFCQIRIDHENRTDPASEPDADVVERVARAMFVSDPPAGMIGPDWDTGATLGKGNATRHKFHALARAAIAAMRPVSVDPVKLAEIRARHEHLDGQLSKRTTEITAYEGYSAHADRAFLLSAFDGVK